MATRLYVGALCALLIVVFSSIGQDIIKAYSRPDVFLLNVEIEPKTAESFKLFLDDRDSGDVLTVQIESFGGYVVSEHKILYYLKHSDANIICTVDSHAASAAAMIFMACPIKKVTPQAEITFHVIQMCTEVGMFGCAKMVPVSPTLNPEAYKKSLEELGEYKYIFTKEEWTAMTQGKDITITGETLIKRIDNPEIISPL